MHLEVFVGPKDNEQLLHTVYEEDLIEWWFTDEVRKQIDDPEFHYVKIDMTKADWSHWCEYEAERVFSQQCNPSFPLQEASQLLQKACYVLDCMYNNKSAYVLITRDF